MLNWFDAVATVAISQMRKQAQVGWHAQSFLESARTQPWAPTAKSFGV